MSVSDFEKAAARKRLLSTMLKSRWLAVSPDLAGRPGGPIIYLGDVDSGRMFVVALIRNGIALMREQGKIHGITQDQIADALMTLLADLGSDKLQLDPEIRSDLAAAAGLFVAGTLVYDLAQRMRLNQFLVLRYPDASTGGYLLRPTALQETTMLSPAEVEMAAEALLEMDRQNHPQRFRSGKVLAFKVKKRDEV